MLGLWVHGNWTRVAFWNTSTSARCKEQVGSCQGKGLGTQTMFPDQVAGHDYGSVPTKAGSDLGKQVGGGEAVQVEWGRPEEQTRAQELCSGKRQCHLGFPPTPPTLCVSLEDKLPQHLGAHYVRGQPVSRQRNLPKEDLDRQRQIADLFADAPGPLLLEPPASND